MNLDEIAVMNVFMLCCGNTTVTAAQPLQMKLAANAAQCGAGESRGKGRG